MPSIINSDDGVSSGTSGLKTTGGNDGILALQNNGTTNVTVTAAGNVGVGTSSPSVAANYKVIVIQGSTTSAGGVLQLQTSDSSYQAQFYTDTNGTTISSTGNYSMRFQTNSTLQAAITSAGLFQFNSGYGSVATAYGCRAWVNFDGTANTNLSGTYSQSGTTVTVTATAHGLIAGNSVYSDITTGTAVDGTYTVATVTDANTFTYTAGTSLTTSGNVTLRRNTIRASGNVSSIADNGTGDYTVNFSTAMPDANYCFTIGYRGVSNNDTDYTPALYTGSDPTTSAIRFVTNNMSLGSLTDINTVCVAIFR